MNPIDRNTKLIIRFLSPHKLIDPYTLKTVIFQVNYQAVKMNFPFYQSGKTNVAIKTVEDLKAFFLNFVPESKCLRGEKSLPKSIMN